MDLRINIFYLFFVLIIIQFVSCNEEKINLNISFEPEFRIVNFNCRHGYQNIGNRCRKVALITESIKMKLKIFAKSFQFLILLLIIGNVSNTSFKTYSSTNWKAPSVPDISSAPKIPSGPQLPAPVGPSGPIGPPQSIGPSNSYNSRHFGSPPGYSGSNYPNTANMPVIGPPGIVTVNCRDGYRPYGGGCRQAL